MSIEDPLIALMGGTDQIAVDCEEARHFRDFFVTRKNEIIMLALIRVTNLIASSENDASTSRALAEGEIRKIESALALQDNGVTPNAGDLKWNRRCLREHLTKFMKSQRDAHVFLKQFTDTVKELESLYKQLSEWTQTLREDSCVKQKASSLVCGIETALTMFAGYVDRVKANVAIEPAAYEDQVLTARVIEFREQLAEERKEIRANLAAEAEVECNNEKA